MKIIILDHEPFSARKNNHFFIQEFRNKGIEVEFWSLWKMFPYSKKINYHTALEGPQICYIKTKRELRKKFNEIDNKNTFLFVEFWFNSQTWHVHQLLVQNNIKWGRIEYYHNPTYSFYLPQGDIATPKKWSRYKNLLTNIFSLDYIKFHLLLKFDNTYIRNIMTADISFITGENSGTFSQAKKHTSIDYFDVETYRIEKAKTPLLNYPYTVFADIFLGKHPDLQIHHGNDYMDMDEYYKKLNTFFDHLEASLGMPVVIAAHPKSSYKDEFKGRKCIKNETANLIINSQLVVQHASLSISYALLAEKKVIQFYDNSFLVNPVLNRFYHIMRNVSSQTATPCINIDEENDYKKLYAAPIQQKLYQQILSRFFTKPKEVQLTNFEIVGREIEKIMGFQFLSSMEKFDV
ncbi:hypothetical protein [Sphingobacterium faecium]|uniref:hypothetical protein n=1 Tax=Sphingobacterium faecium TaxID=34087 RepID=UPI00320B2BC1